MFRMFVKRFMRKLETQHFLQDYANSTQGIIFTGFQGEVGLQIFCTKLLNFTLQTFHQPSTLKNL